MRHCGGKRWEKLWIRWLTIPRSIWAWFWGKRWKNLQNDQNWLFWANLSHLFWQNSPLWVILSYFSVKWFKKVEELQIIWQCIPTPLQKQKFLRFLQKWETLVVKDGKSCESGEIGHSKSIWASFWQKRWKNLQNDQNWPFWSESKPLMVAKFTIEGHFEVLWCEMIWKRLKNSKHLLMFHPFPRNENFWDFSKNETLWW